VRTTFNISLRADVWENDEAAREAFTSMLKDNAETLYAQLAMISRSPPLIDVEISDEEVGRTKVQLFLPQE
jgi:hypothetical protein